MREEGRRRKGEGKGRGVDYIEDLQYPYRELLISRFTQ